MLTCRQRNISRKTIATVQVHNLHNTNPTISISIMASINSSLIDRIWFLKFKKKHSRRCLILISLSPVDETECDCLKKIREDDDQLFNSKPRIKLDGLWALDFWMRGDGLFFDLQRKQEMKKKRKSEYLCKWFNISVYISCLYMCVSESMNARMSVYRAITFSSQESRDKETEVEVKQGEQADYGGCCIVYFRRKRGWVYCFWFGKIPILHYSLSHSCMTCNDII